MKMIALILPDPVMTIAASNAREKGIDLASYCGAVLAEALLTPIAAPLMVRDTRTASTPDEVENRSQSAGFDVKGQFAGFPSGSVRLAQRFVDEALKLKGMKAFKKGRGVGFEPNVVFLEYLMSRGGKNGIVASFYGKPDRHSEPPPILKKGLPSYSRAKICNEQDLEAILPHIWQAFELKFGKQ